MSANPATSSTDNPTAVPKPVWDVDASTRLPAGQRSTVPRGELLTQETVLLPAWDIDAALPGATGGEIALVVTVAAPAISLSDLSALFQALDAGERALGGQGISFDPDNSHVGDDSTELLLRPIEPKGANARLQSLIAPLGGTGTIADWNATNGGPTALLTDLATELAKPSRSDVRSVASFRDQVRAQIVLY